MFKGLGRGYKETIRSLCDRAWSDGLDGERYMDWVLANVPGGAFDTWKGAHREIIQMVHDQLQCHRIWHEHCLVEFRVNRAKKFRVAKIVTEGVRYE
jgi:hypothetical protein